VEAHTASRRSGPNPVTVTFDGSVSVGTNTVPTFFYWDLNGDGTNEWMGEGLSHVSWVYSQVGSYSVSLLASNALGQHVSVSKQDYIRVGNDAYYVSPNGAHTFPYTNWTDAATNIQAAVDASVEGSVVFVTNGTYVSASQIIVTNGITIQSVNGATWTTVDGGYPWYTNRCFYLGHSNSVLTGFTITNGYAPGTENPSEACGGGIAAVSGALVWNCIITGNKAVGQGGGVSGGTVSNCLLIGNATVGGGWSGPYGGWSTPGYGGAAAGSIIYGSVLTHNSASTAGAVAGGMLIDCMIVSNTAAGWCGAGAGEPTWFGCVIAGNSAGYACGASDGSFFNCTIVGNSAGAKIGGVDGWEGDAYLLNCIVYSNSAPESPNYRGGAYDYCCITPDPGGMGNTTNDPQFVNITAGDFRLANNSPCINTGTNQDWMNGAKDLDGNQRIINGRADMGAYESSFWGMYSDVDGDGIKDADEIYADTDPTNKDSVLAITTLAPSGSSISIGWKGGTAVTQYLERCTTLATNPIPWMLIFTNVPPTATITNIVDSSAGITNAFYRIRVAR